MFKNFKKQAYNKKIKLQSYISSKKIWLNSKYLKIKQNCKLKTKFFCFFLMLYLVTKQTHKLYLFKKIENL